VHGEMTTAQVLVSLNTRLLSFLSDRLKDNMKKQLFLGAMNNRTTYWNKKCNI